MTEDANRQKRATGSACFALHRNSIQLRPRFLRRNLRYILDSHERLLHPELNERASEDMIANEKRDWGWDFPTTEMLEEYMNGNTPILQLESLQIRSPGSKTSVRKRRHDEHSNQADGLEWLPPPDADNVWPCTVGVAVSIPKDNQSSRRQIHFESVPATLIRCARDDKRPSFDVWLAKPLFIRIEKLFVVTDSGGNGTRSWKRTITASYQLDITVQCEDSEDSSNFLGLLESKDASSYHGAPGSEAVLKATWNDLPACPPHVKMLPLKRAKGHKSLELDHKMGVAMGWISRRDYLNTYNKVWAAKRDSSRQLPTPSASDDMEKVGKRYSIAWKFRDTSATKVMTVQSVSCPICKDSRDYDQISRLMLHCMHHHPQFSFEREDEINEPDSPIFRATIWLDAAPQAHDKPNEDEDVNISWVAPSRPFNIKAYIRGEDDWTGQVRSKSKKGGARQAKEKEVSSVLPPQPSRKRPAPEEVEDLPEHKAKKHCVPHVPGVRFYRKISKQLIRPGEFLAESDDDVDESWLAQAQAPALEDLGVCGASKAFTMAFDQHLAREQSDSSVLTRDALVRFARHHTDELKDVQWQRLFRAKLNQLRAFGIIGDEIVSYCVQLIQQTSEAERPETSNGPATTRTQKDATNGISTRAHGVLTGQRQANGETTKSQQENVKRPNGTRSKSPENSRIVQRERRKWNVGKTGLREVNMTNGASTPRSTKSPREKTPAQNDLALDDRQRNASHARNQTCTCGKQAKYARGSIACADPVSFPSWQIYSLVTDCSQRCTRKDYHLACVGLERREPAWRCAECSA